MALQTRTLGASSIEVSVMSLGSFKTFEKVSRETGLEIMRAAQDEGITFLDDSAYADDTGTAPIPIGYSEVVFGELFRAAQWVRDEVVLAKSSGGASGRQLTHRPSSAPRWGVCNSITSISSTRSHHPRS